jgi:hypothetical protein
LLKVLAHMTHRRAWGALMGWSDHVRAMRRQRELLRKVAARLENTSVARSFSHWADLIVLHTLKVTLQLQGEQKLAALKKKVGLEQFSAV